MHLEILFRAAEGSQFPQALPRFRYRLTQVKNLVNKHGQILRFEGYCLQSSTDDATGFLQRKPEKCQPICVKSLTLV